MAQSYLRNPSIERLPTLLEELHTGSLCIPPFQRDFAWAGTQRLALCESIGRGLPTGSLMVWRTAKKLKSENPVGPYLLFRKDPVRGVQYLLDGRQRMTTMYAALAAAFWTRDDKTPPDPNPGWETSPDNTPWGIVYDLANQNFAYEQRMGRYEDPNLSLFEHANISDGSRHVNNFLPLAILFDDTAYDEWRNSANLNRELANRARAIRSAFTDYQIPVVPLATDDISVVTTTFKRINNGGTPMSDADMARALAWSEGFDLRAHIENAREKLRPSGWGDVEDDPLLAVVAAVSGIEPTDADPEKLAAKIRENTLLVEEAGKYVISAASLLRSKIGIAGPKSLPYEQILVFSARAYHEAGGTLTEVQENALAAWVAEVCVDERFGGAPDHVVKAEWRTFSRRLGLPKADPSGSRRDERPLYARECRKFSLAWARSKGTALVFADQCPRTADGAPIENPWALVATGSEDVGMLVAEGGGGLPSLVAQMLKAKSLKGAALSSPANRVICPRAQMPELRIALFEEGCSKDILGSHLISPIAHDALVAGNFDQFFETRRRDILEAEKRWVAERGGQVQIQLESRSYAEG
jgi:Protein of unknown function DUF262